MGVYKETLSGTAIWTTRKLLQIDLLGGRHYRRDQSERFILQGPERHDPRLGGIPLLPDCDSGNGVRYEWVEIRKVQKQDWSPVIPWFDSEVNLLNVDVVAFCIDTDHLRRVFHVSHVNAGCSVDFDIMP